MVSVKFYPQSKLDTNQNKSSKSDKIETSKSSEKFYYYIRNGDFDLVWTNIIVFIIGHILFIQLYYELIVNWGTDSTHCYTLIFVNCLAPLLGIGITGGAHRLWAHKSYDAKLPLRVILMIGQTIAGQNCIYIWARDHRVHHKFSDTDGDPHNMKRGFFFTHCGWLMRKKHPEMLEKSRTLDFGDLLRDPVVKFQKDYYWYLYFMFAFFLPLATPMYFWNESFYYSFLGTYVGRYILSLHGTWFVNSAAHMFGERPYKHNIEPVENPFVSVITFGEGYHNYHHSFPNDYQASEDGHGLNITKHLIDLMARIGQAYNLRTASNHLITMSRENSAAKHAANQSQSEVKAN